MFLNSCNFKSIKLSPYLISEEMTWSLHKCGGVRGGGPQLGRPREQSKYPCLTISATCRADGNREQRVSSVALNTGSRRRGVASGELMVVRNSTIHLGRKSTGRGQVVQREYFIQSLIVFAD